MTPTIPDTTICCVDCSAHELAARALVVSMAQCRFDQALLFTDRPMQVAGVEVRVIPTIASTADYSQFLLKELRHHITTEFVLVTQWDGYVIDGREWRSDFLTYDYIGARWPHVPGVEVGNGGFSLRSRRLLEACGDERFVMGHPEDAAICVNNRHFLETEKGIRFAPPEVAERFSFERTRDGGPHFGFHGLFNLPFVMADEELPGFVAALPPRVAWMGELFEALLAYMATGRVKEARIVWHWLKQQRSEADMVDFMRQNVRPQDACENIIAALTAAG